MKNKHRLHMSVLKKARLILLLMPSLAVNTMLFCIANRERQGVRVGSEWILIPLIFFWNISAVHRIHTKHREVHHDSRTGENDRADGTAHVSH